MLFNKGDIVVAKDGFLDKNETLQDTAVRQNKQENKL